MGTEATIETSSSGITKAKIPIYNKGSIYRAFIGAFRSGLIDHASGFKPYI